MSDTERRIQDVIAYIEELVFDVTGEHAFRDGNTGGFTLYAGAVATKLHELVALATTGGETAGYMVVAKRPRLGVSGFDYAPVGSVWDQVEPCENHQAYCQMAAEQDPERYGDVEYQIVRLSPWVPVDPTKEDKSA